MRADKQTEKCFLCGSAEHLTRGHVPAENLFKPPLPTNMVTLPECRPCNESYSLDEEYFRACVATQGTWSETGSWIWENKVINSSFRRSPKLRKAITANMFSVPVHTPAGVYLGQQGGVGYRVDRTERVVKKICRGLYTHHRPMLDTNNLS